MRSNKENQKPKKKSESVCFLALLVGGDEHMSMDEKDLQYKISQLEDQVTFLKALCEIKHIENRLLKIELESTTAVHKAEMNALANKVPEIQKAQAEMDAVLKSIK